jgi:hypothetical protein
MRRNLLLAALAFSLLARLSPAANDGIISHPPQGTRPYIFLTPARVAEIQAKRAANHYLWTRFAGRLAQGDNDYYWTLPEFCAGNALAYHITNDGAYLTECKRLYNAWITEGDCYAGGDGLCYQWTGRYFAWAYDWAYAGLTPAERTAWRNHLKEAAQLWYDDMEWDTGGGTAYNWGISYRDSDHASFIAENLLYAGLACYGDDNAAAETFLEAHDAIRTNIIEPHYLGDFFAGGFDPVGPMYGCPQESHMLRPLIVDAEARTVAMPANVAEDFLEFTVYTTFPQYKGTLQLGDVHTTNYQPDQWTQEWTTPQDQIPFMCIATGVATDPLAKAHGLYWIDRMEKLWDAGPYPFNWEHFWNKQPTTLEAVLFAPMVSNPAPPAALGAPTTFFAEGGLVAMRTSWEDDAVCLWFQNTDWNVDHTHEDALHYTILRNNMPVNSELSGYWGAEEPSCYHAISHNTLLIENMDGGDQTMSQADTFGKIHNGEVSIDVVDSDDDFGYIQGEGGPAYNFLGWNGTDSSGETACEHAIRKILWMKPDRFIVYDYVKSPAALGNRWKKQVNHFHGQPQLASGVYRAVSDGNAYFFKPLSPAAAGILVQDDTTVFTATGGTDFLDDQKHWTMTVDAGSTATPVEFVSAQFLADAVTASMPGAVLIHSGDNAMTGVHYKDAAVDQVGLMRKGPGTQTTVSYTITPTAGASVRHWVTDFTGPGPLQAYAKGTLNAGSLQVTVATSPFAGSVPVSITAEGTAFFLTGVDGSVVSGPGGSAVTGWELL